MIIIILLIITIIIINIIIIIVILRSMISKENSNCVRTRMRLKLRREIWNFIRHLKCARNRSFVNDETSLQTSNRILFLAYVLSKHVYDIIETHALDVSLFLYLIIKLTLLVQRIPKKNWWNTVIFFHCIRNAYARNDSFSIAVIFSFVLRNLFINYLANN